MLKRFSILLVGGLLLVAFEPPISLGQVVTPTFVQQNSAVPQSTAVASVSATFSAAQTAGNLNVVAIGWNDTSAAVTSVSDTVGNLYTRAVGPTAGTGLSQSIYYAKNIVSAAGGANRVTVTFSPSAAYPDLRVLEYKGIDPVAPVDVTAAGSGSSSTSNSGSVTTTNATDLLFGANGVATSTSGPGTGFTQRVITRPDGDIAEDRVVTTVGDYGASAPLKSSGPWVMQMVAFRSAVIGPPDTTPPSAPANLAATAASSTQINLSWTASTDDVGVTGYRVERCQGDGCSTFAQIATSVTTTFNDTGLAVGASYSYRVRAADAAGNLSGYSATATATTLPDTTPPTTPTNLIATAASSTQINLTWTASTDNVAVTSYLVERCQDAGCATFAQIATSTTAAFSDPGLTAGTSYSYRIRATDAAGNLSAYSATTTASTPAVDTTPPSTPSNLSATALSSSQITLAWTASTDNIGVTGYRAERCQGASCTTFSQIATPTATTFTDSSLVASTAYSYRVRANDAAGNLSGYSNVASATTSAPSSANPAFVQVNSAVPQSSAVSTVTVTYTGAQTAGNLNVVIIGWNNTTGAVASITDTSGNAYTLAVGPTIGIGITQSMYIAKNIAGAAAGVNKVTVTFNPGAAYPDIRILEYTGIDAANPLDVTAASTGSNSTSTSGNAITSNANDMLVAGNTVATTTSAAGTGFTSRGITSPNGDISEDRFVTALGTYSATATLGSAGPWVMQMVALRAAGSPPPPPDTTPPVVSITAPTQGSTVLGFVPVTANATDNVAVAGVQFKADGGNIGAEDTTFPYSVTWDTSSLPVGSHSLTAVARDTAGNTTTSSTVTASVQSAATLGQWLAPESMPLVAVHSTLMPNGKILIIDGQSFGQFPQVWDLTSNTFTQVNSPINLFCSGHTLLADGRVIVLGGHDGAAHVGLTGNNIFNPQTQTWTVAAAMADRRWYPTATALPDGRVLVQSGETNCDGCFVARPDIYNPTNNNWTQLTSAAMSFPYYPHTFVLPDGRILVSSTAEAPIISRVLNLNTQTWTAIGSTALDGGSAVMYRPGKILKVGTSANPDLAVRPSSANSYVLDMTQPSPAWRQVASMAFARTYATMVMLPDGTVFTEGGGTTTEAVDPAKAVYAAEIWDPATETWTTVGSAATPRLYHSTALLMPDGRVWVAGGGRFVDGTVSTDRFSAEFYLPPYLFKGARPTITSAPSTIQYSQAFSVQTPNAADISSVALIRIGSVTHAFNMSQYYVPLTFTAGSGSLTVQAPANSNLAPPGYYMLFILNTNGVPSVASIMNLPVTTGSTQPPNAPTNLVGSGGVGSVSLSWSPATGPNGIAGYSVYRGTAPGVVPSSSNRVGQPTTTTYVDSSIPSSGNYYYVVTARDSTGTESGPSNEVVVTVTSDLVPPTDPSALSATAVSNSQIDLSWTGSTDDVGVSSYLVERCQGTGCSDFTQIGTPTNITFSDTGLSASTSYSYRVRARDAAGNLSGYTNTASATTSDIPTPPATPTFKQQANAVPQSASVSTMTATFAAAQTAGDLNVVIVGWNDTTASITGVIDSAGNAYTRAVGPTMGSGLTQSIYYAKNIVASVAGVNKVTVTFSPAAHYPDLRVLEYSGIDTATAVDVTAAAVGNSSSSSSGTAITTNPTDLLVGGNTVATLTAGPGAGFTNRVITSPNGDIAEDQNVTTTGTYSATAPLSGAGPWVMQMVAFRAAGSPAPALLMIEGGPPLQ